MQRQNVSPYCKLIFAATEAPVTKLAILENIMRDVIFHSALDLQTADQLAVAADMPTTFTGPRRVFTTWEPSITKPHMP